MDATKRSNILILCESILLVSFDHDEWLWIIHKSLSLKFESLLNPAFQRNSNDICLHKLKERTYVAFAQSFK